MNLAKLTKNAVFAETFLKAIANRHRLLILCELHKGERSVTRLLETLDLSQSSLSQHLARLRKDQIVKTRRESQTIYYSLADSSVTRIISTLYDIYCSETANPSRKKTLERTPRP
jgi:DNA-binding transcriptional ArsR family regulator